MEITQIVCIVIAVLLLIVSGFVSGSEIAFFSLTPVQIDELEEDTRQSSSKRILHLLSSPERLLATVLIANNLVNVAIVVLLNFALGHFFTVLPAWASFILQTVILTFLILLFGEILPKLYANTDNLRWARFASVPLLSLQRLFYPMSSVLVGSSSIIRRVVTPHHENLTADELSQVMEITDMRGDKADKEMLEGILKFGDTTAGEIMTSRMDMTDIAVNATFDEVLQTIVDSGYARIPVYEKTQDNIRGILYSKDLLPFIGPGKEPPADWRTLVRDAYFVPESRMIDDLLEDFRSRRIHMAIVVDEFGGTQGIVTLEDVLEEIVGDIDDEYDDESKTYRRLPDDTFIFEGKTMLTDFFRVTGLDEADYEDYTSDCETLAGMLLALKGDFPKEKESLVCGRCRFLVIDIDKYRITSVRVKIMPEIQNS